MYNNEKPLPIIECEVRDAILNLKNGKSPGIDNIQSELLKYKVESLIQIFATLFLQILKTIKWPSSKGDTTCNQYYSKNNIKPSKLAS